MPAQRLKRVGGEYCSFILFLGEGVDLLGPNYTMAGVKTHQRDISRGPGRNLVSNRLDPPREATCPPLGQVEVSIGSNFSSQLVVCFHLCPLL
jgi:hypothetical protein